MDFKLTDEQEARRKEMFAVCAELAKTKPAGFSAEENVDATPESWEFHRHCMKEFARRGWLSLGWPVEYGGIGAPIERVFFNEARGYHGLPGVDGFGVRMLAPTLLAVASEEIKSQFLPGIASGETTWCQLWSEPNAGSDLAALSTTAIRKGDEYVINGQKIWTSGGHHADWGFGLFKTDPQGRKRHNLSFILLDMKTPGITIRPILWMDRGHIFNEVFFDDVHVPARNIVGEENQGWAVSQALSNNERSGIETITGMQRQLQDLVQYCRETKVNGEPLAKNPVVRNRLAKVACEIEAGRALAFRIVDLQSRKEMAGSNASIIKVFTGELTERLAALGTDILGVYGQVKFSRWAPQEGSWEKAYQQCFIQSISMGTDEIQKNIMAWYGLGLPRTY